MSYPSAIRGLLGLGWGLLAAAVWAVEPSDRPLPDRWRLPGPQPVETVAFDWTDAARNRQVPVKIYYPKSDTRCAVVIMSHGLGGSREGYEYLGRHWASHGYVSVHPQHQGSDDSVWKGAGNMANVRESLQKASGELANAANRPKDVTFVIDRLQQLDKEDGPLRSRLDCSCIGMAGHSFGAYATLAVAGQSSPNLLGRSFSLADSRIRAAAPLSAPAPRRRDNLDQVYGSIKIPCLHMTGTLDDSPIRETKASERRLPFDHIRGVEQYLVTFVGGDHMIFSGRPRRAESATLPGWKGNSTQDALFQGFICAITTAFWDAYLHADPQARQWLSGGACQKYLGQHAQFETKSP